MQRYKNTNSILLESTKLRFGSAEERQQEIFPIENLFMVLRHGYKFTSHCNHIFYSVQMLIFLFTI